MSLQHVLQYTGRYSENSQCPENFSLYNACSGREDAIFRRQEVLVQDICAPMDEAEQFNKEVRDPAGGITPTK